MSRRGSKGDSSLRLGWIIFFVIALLLLTRTFMADLAVVRGRSMLPALEHSDLVFVFKAAYGIKNPWGGYILRWSEPREGQLVAAVRPDSAAAFIKRVDSVISLETPESSAGAQKAYFLLGDNKYESIDSRDFGPVPMNNILGRVFPLPGF
ncbi:MAG: S26 family signal peptidase [Spirochaetia bacterium]|nr:S26 family signal peptidase [Spirochaetales bacterium]MDX9783305.1 S26 family signal peptidase [Spirochaetia bacterium]